MYIVSWETLKKYVLWPDFATIEKDNYIVQVSFWDPALDTIDWLINLRRRSLVLKWRFRLMLYHSWHVYVNCLFTRMNRSTEIRPKIHVLVQNSIQLLVLHMVTTLTCKLGNSVFKKNQPGCGQCLVFCVNKSKYCTDWKNCFIILLAFLGVVYTNVVVVHNVLPMSISWTPMLGARVRSWVASVCV